MNFARSAKSEKGFLRRTKGADHRVTVSVDGDVQKFYFKDAEHARTFQIIALRALLRAGAPDADVQHDVERLNLACYGGKQKLYWEGYGTPACCSPASETYWSM